MADECRNRDLDRVGVKQDWELRNWSREFGVTAEELQAAVNAVGVRVVELRRYLDGRRDSVSGPSAGEKPEYVAK